MTRALVLVDGEHYPPVVLDAIQTIESRGYRVMAAVFLGGKEKIGGAPRVGDYAIVTGATQVAALDDACRSLRPDVVIDVSDAPVVDTRRRALLAAVAAARGVVYEAAGMRLEPPPTPRLCAAPSVAVVGTGKRTGKTALAAWIARWLAAAGERPAMVCMGRGGPPDPVVVRGDETELTVADLLEAAEAGRHAASDFYEDAVLARVPTVGARRAGAGPAGATITDNVAEAIECANALDAGIILLEGSGTALPPAAADATVLVAGGATPDWEIRAGIGPHRLLIADLVVVTMAEEPILASGTLPAIEDTLRDLGRDIPIIRTVFRPRPTGPVTGKKIFFATTAPEQAGPMLRAYLEEVAGAEVVGMTHRLADRAALSHDLASAEGKYEVLLTEIKAAAIDVAARAAVNAGAEVVFADNEPVGIEGDLGEAADVITAAAKEMFRRAGGAPEGDTANG